MSIDLLLADLTALCMARTPRLYFSGAFARVIARDNRRATIFHDKELGSSPALRIPWTTP
ncbi:MAG: hypothetical protein OEV77_14940 [Nitrospira sp.]|nr:hypothetical protein [Nitrospira sp.]